MENYDIVNSNKCKLYDIYLKIIYGGCKIDIKINKKLIFILIEMRKPELKFLINCE